MPGREVGARWNDPTLNIPWQLDGLPQPSLSDKDAVAPSWEVILRDGLLERLSS
jgi:dTDP-4-dehydrorhamnose 3,5-epimerase-like enzyme